MALFLSGGSSDAPEHPLLLTVSLHELVVLLCHTHKVHHLLRGTVQVGHGGLHSQGLQGGGGRGVVLVQRRRRVEQASAVRERQVVVEVPYGKAGCLEERRSVCGVTDTLPSLSDGLPPHQDGVELTYMEEVDGVVSGSPAADGASDEALDIDADEEVEEAMELLELSTGQREEVAFNYVSTGEPVVQVLPPQTAPTGSGRDAVFAHPERSSDDTPVSQTRGVPKSVFVVPDCCRVGSHGEGSPVVVGDGQGAVEVSEKVLKLKQEVSVEHEELALRGRGGLGDVVAEGPVVCVH